MAVTALCLSTLLAQASPPSPIPEGGSFPQGPRGVYHTLSSPPPALLPPRPLWKLGTRRTSAWALGRTPSAEPETRDTTTTSGLLISKNISKRQSWERKRKGGGPGTRAAGSFSCPPQYFCYSVFLFHCPLPTPLSEILWEIQQIWLTTCLTSHPIIKAVLKASAFRANLFLE